MDNEGCIKCGSKNAATKEISTTGSGLSKMFDLQNNKFLVVYCKECGYSELYNRETSTASNLLDLFFGG
ncbi:zinc ribbon domain-containing protein [Senegalia massiliensis]|jgi:predicted nucleic-acid-binding Zn-ribbon protein|uniref:Uncharacterized protein n=1 Tax=Senegalia massiliensis TaxID=1720316 RepID=A0A845R3D1_9CLOT|nr:zinc ribbon domain-containing protein [Senegalia massiliensis]NBI07942.1 hypothetical protein [Senegalia massiliensis]